MPANWKDPEFDWEAAYKDAADLQGEEADDFMSAEERRAWQLQLYEKLFGKLPDWLAPPPAQVPPGFPPGATIDKRGAVWLNGRVIADPGEPYRPGHSAPSPIDPIAEVEKPRSLPTWALLLGALLLLKGK